MLYNIILFIIIVFLFDIAFNRLYNKLLELIDFFRFGAKIKELDDGGLICENIFKSAEMPKKPLLSSKTKKYLKYFAYLMIFSILSLGCLAIFAHIFRIVIDAMLALSSI